jgi:hypothetical protein
MDLRNVTVLVLNSYVYCHDGNPFVNTVEDTRRDGAVRSEVHWNASSAEHGSISAARPDGTTDKKGGHLPL